jgi:transcription-repair coupling factor (superfamily II helicase)
LNNSILQRIYAEHSGVKAILSSLNKAVPSVYLKGLSGSAASLVCASVFTQSKRKHILCVLNDLEEAGYFYHDCCQAIGEEEVFFFPSLFKRNIRYGQRDAASEILRTELLNHLSQKAPSALIVTYPEAIAEKVVSIRRLKNNTLNLSIKQKIDQDFVVDVLKSYGFEWTNYVYEPGQYAVRGSILDVYSYANEYPYRIDFFGDEIESIRSFEVETQLSKQRLETVSILSAQSGEADTSLFSYLPAHTRILFRSHGWVRDKCQLLWNEPPILTEDDPFASLQHIQSHLYSPDKLFEEIEKHSHIHLGDAPKSADPDQVILFSTRPQLSYRKNFDLVSASFKQKIDEGYDLYILSSNEKQIKRIQSIFQDRGDDIPFTPLLQTIHEGFIDQTLRICLFTDHQIFDRFHKYTLKSEKARSGKFALSLKELQQFQPGDYLVHIDHGVGRFGGLLRIEINGRTQEVVKMNFLNDDIIFVSIHNLHKISKYKGKDGEPPRLNKLGTDSWDNLKQRTKRKVKDIAKELIQLYSRRRDEQGFSFSPDTYLQRELEASFIYEDTPDQLKATNDIKHDMESTRPMDRLVCGDVGFGKTEVAIRAAFKAVGDGKQVAVLVPTTLLAFQHYHTFKERLANFPITIDYLSRARNVAATDKILEKLSRGQIDILIGTHRLIGKDVFFKDLGLLIVDEEQKFGVTVKEKLKHLKINVDTLTMTATPIPRTLQFSLMGARDLSNIATPPPNRYPIHTEIQRFSGEIIREAILFEMSRNGQTFIVNNHVMGLPQIVQQVQDQVPDARIAIGHGQMKPEMLEKVILGFVNYEYDVLIATSIIENGIDIPNANTIIVNNAHYFGLSDLHQLRGRVGRSNKKAFCYLLAPPLSELSTEARRRLQAIENFSELGSGIHVAMQDLDIRGAGNMLGAEQSGFIADLGYETYQKILSEAVQELKNEEFASLYKDENQHDSGENYVSETNVESDLELLLPPTYIPNDSERILLYRELDSMTSPDDIQDFRARLQDRFGPIPAKTEALIQIVPLRLMAKKLGIDKIILRTGSMTLYLIVNPKSSYYQSVAFDKLLEYIKQNPKICRLFEKNNRRLLNIQNVTSVEQALQIIQTISDFPPNS